MLWILGVKKELFHCSSFHFRMNLTKEFEHLRFPWKFNGHGFYNLLPLRPKLDEELQEIKPGFELAFKSLLKGIVNQEDYLLKSVLEPRMLSEVHNCLSTVSRRNHSLQIVNTDSPVFVFFYNAQVTKGVDLVRNQNVNNSYEVESLADYREKLVEAPRLDAQDIFFYTKLGKPQDNHLVFKVDVVVYSSVKLIVKNENSEVIFGNESTNPERHKFRFEIMKKMQPGLLQNVVSTGWAISYFACNKGSWPFCSSEWMVTDIDDHLQGNPYHS